MKKLFFLWVAIVSMGLASCNESELEIDDLNTRPYIHDLFIAFEDEAGNNLAVGMSSPKDTNIVNENDYNLYVTVRGGSRYPVYKLKYKTINGKRYLDFSRVLLNHYVESITFEFICKHIVGNTTRHQIEAQYEASDVEVIRPCVGFEFDGTYYPAGPDGTVTIKLCETDSDGKG